MRWLHDGRTLLWSGRSTIGAVDTSTGEHWQLLSAAADEIYGFAITPDGDELFFDRASEQADLWAMRMENE